MKHLNRLFVFGLAALALAACNTVAGVGRDIETAGDKIEDAATR